MKIKVFVESDPEELERSVNAWLDVNAHQEVVQMLQSQSEDSGKCTFAITILYR